ncbi:MAG: sugar nucleotide-binding protein, partial [Pseudomonadota bacterium]
LITRARAVLAGTGQSGIYHFSGAPDVSWADFAREIFAQSGLSCAVEDIPASAYPTPARRPANSRLDCTSLETAFGIPRPDWRRSLTGVLQELGAAA